MSNTDTTETDEPRKRADFLHTHGAPMTWFIMDISEVRALNVELTNTRAERDVARRERDEIKHQRDMLDCAENRRAIGMGETKGADAEISNLHRCLDELSGRFKISVSERDALKAELATAKADTARLDWLGKSGLRASFEEGTSGHHDIWFLYERDAGWGYPRQQAIEKKITSLRSAIDSAMNPYAK